MSEPLLRYPFADAALPSVRDLTVAQLQSVVSRNISQNVLGAVADSYALGTVRYKPGEKFVLSLLSDAGKPISIRVFPDTKVFDRFVKARRHDAQLTFLLPEINGIAWVFPAERKLKLRSVADPHKLAALTQKYRGFRLTSQELMHYVPEHTYTLRLQGARADGAPVTEYLKVYYDRRGARLARIANELAVQLRDAEIAVPGETFYLPLERIQFQSALERDYSQPVDIESAAHALARFHTLQANSATRRRDETIAQIEQTRRLAGATFPALARRLDDVCRAAIALHAGRPRCPDVLVHGDPHLGNIFFTTDGRTGFIDLDAVHYGAAERDLASFFAFKLWLCIRGDEGANDRLDAFPRLVRAYNDGAQFPVLLEHAYLELAIVMIVERISRGIVRGKLSDLQEASDFVDVAGLCIKRARNG